MRSRRSEKPLIVRITADDPVEHDHIGRLDAVWICGDVEEPSLYSAFDPGFPEEPCRFPVVGRRHFEIDRTSGTSLQEFDLHFAESATNLENSRALNSTPFEKRNHPTRRLVDPLLAIALRSAARQTRREVGVTTARVTAVRHAWQLKHPSTLSPQGRDSPSQRFRTGPFLSRPALLRALVPEGSAQSRALAGQTQDVLTVDEPRRGKVAVKLYAPVRVLAHSVFAMHNPSRTGRHLVDRENYVTSPMALSAAGDTKGEVMKKVTLVLALCALALAIPLSALAKGPANKATGDFWYGNLSDAPAHFVFMAHDSGRPGTRGASPSMTRSGIPSPPTSSTRRS